MTVIVRITIGDCEIYGICRKAGTVFEIFEEPIHRNMDTIFHI